jgi:membrane-bound lytic murein transglycosylase B
VLLCAGTASAQKLDVTRPEIQQFITGLAQRQGFEGEAVTGVLRDAVSQKAILELIARPAERTLAWWEYRPRFMTEERIKAGLALWNEQQPTLERIALERGVPAEYLLAIVGVETFYGRIMGRNRVLDALATLAFDYPPRSDYFTRELEQFLLLTREEQLDPRIPVGSYAGAMGAPQFMPTSVRNYAVDGDGDGHRDLWKSWPDVFASIANYFVAHGWRKDEPVLAEAQWLDAPATATPDDPAAARLELADSVGSLRGRGYRFDTPLPDSARVMLIPARLEKSLAWRVGFENFYVITRYNRSSMYAMAVHDLAMTLADRRRQQLALAPSIAP